MTKFKKEELVYLWGNTFPLFNAEAAIGYTVLDDILAAKSELIFYIDNGYKVSLGKSRLLDQAKKFGDAFLNYATYEKHVSSMDELFEKREKLIKTVNTIDLSTQSNEQLFELAQKYHEIFGRIFGHMVISRPECADHLSDRLLEILTENSKEEGDTNKDFEILISPTELDIIKKEKIAKLKLMDDISNEACKKYILEYPWVYGYKYTQDEAIEELKKDLKKEDGQKLTRTIADFQADLKALKKEKVNILEKYNDPEISLLSERLSFMGHNRLEIKARFAGFVITVWPLFEEISKRCDVNPKSIIDNYFLSDLKRLILDNKQISREEIESRKNVVLATQDDNIITLTGSDAIKFKEEHLNQYLQNENNFVTGSIASKGFVIGRCRKMILNDNINLDEFQKGEILITEMTAPSMVPLMNRCAGIITNEGGMVSHAAIISREFKIPCIVGTGSATQVFETGDYVELDANNGKARKLDEEEYNNLLK